MIGDVFYRIGSFIGALDGQLSSLMGSAEGPDEGREIAVYETDDDHDEPTGEDQTAGVVLTALTGWALAGVLRPRSVRWTRVVIAGVAAAALADMVGRLGDEEDGTVGEDPYARTPDELLARFAAGVAVAAGYASLLYPRLPGSPLVKGLSFGALEVMAAPRGGLVRIASEAPGVRFPLQALALPVDEDAGPLAHLAFGFGLGLFYRGDDD